VPKRARVRIAKNRKESAGIPNNLTIEDKKRVKKVKLATKPSTTPRGRVRPELTERTRGRMGKIQGERIVTIPARKAKIISINIGINILAQVLSQAGIAGV